MEIIKIQIIVLSVILAFALFGMIVTVAEIVNNLTSATDDEESEDER